MMKSEKLNAYRHVIQDIAIFEIFNVDDKTWDYYVAKKGAVHLEFVFGVYERMPKEHLRELWKKGYFEEVR